MQQHAAFKAMQRTGATEVKDFSELMLDRLPSWRTPAGEALLANIFKAVDVNDNGEMDADEYLSALFSITTYISCSREGCSKILDVIHHGGQISYGCPEPYVQCHEVMAGSKQPLVTCSMHHHHP